MLDCNYQLLAAACEAVKCPGCEHGRGHEAAGDLGPVWEPSCDQPHLTSPLPAPPRPGPRHRATGARWRHHRQWSQLSPVAPAGRSTATIPDTGACTVTPASPAPADSEHDPGEVCPRAGLRHHLPHRHRALQHVVSSQSSHYIRSA